MKKTTTLALALACFCLAGTMDAQNGRTGTGSTTTPGTPSNPDTPDNGGGNESGNTAPELDANSAGAGLILLAGGALIVLGRRRKALA